MAIEYKLKDLILIKNSKGTVNWNKTLPKLENESVGDWKKRKHKTRSRYSHETRFSNLETKSLVYKKQKLWKTKNSKKVKAYNNEKYNSERYKKLWMAARTRANKQNLEFSLDIDKIKIAIDIGICEITGIKFNVSDERHGAFSPSIDRINNSLGYTNENCKIVCWCFNAGKNHFNINNFIHVCQKVIENKKEILKIYNYG